MSGGISVAIRLPRPEFTLDVDVTLPGQGISGVFGPSGSGKTSLLRVIAGLEAAATGTVRVGEAPWQDERRRLPVEARNVGYVFQEPRLFPHLDVRGNLDYAIRRRATDATAVDEGPILAMLGVEPLLARRVTDLSGGESQRVAIARALLRAPQLLLMDEPLASLDRRRRDEVLPFLDRLHAGLSLPVIYVSHDIDEVCRLCDHLVVMDQGRVLASGDIQDVLTNADLPLFHGDAAGAVVDATVDAWDGDDDLTRLEFSGGSLFVAGRHGEPGRALRLRIRAADVSLSVARPSATSILNVVPATVVSVHDADAGVMLVRLHAGSDRLLARVTRRSVRELSIAPGLELFAQIKSASIRNVPGASVLPGDRRPNGPNLIGP